MKFKTLFLILLINISFKAIGQVVIIQPNFGFKSHPTLNIDKITISNNETLIYLTVENKSSEGDWFCVGKSVELRSFPNSKKMKAKEVKGIARCPETYKFSQVGEKVQFRLKFDALSTNTKYINIQEKCTKACFSFQGVILDQALNAKIDSAYSAYAKGLDYVALDLFKEAVGLSPDYPYPLLYQDIIKIYQELGNKEEAEKWKGKIKH